MNSQLKSMMIVLCGIFTLTISQAEAFCAKCAGIEKAREEEQATPGYKPATYYDDAYKNEITNVPTESAPEAQQNVDVRKPNTNMNNYMQNNNNINKKPS
ncbi:MAG: hypothetical protein H0W88_08700 [Parachlamydiaceae bacterium]|nr:hypothetical protein [Parachlamydiaceae bacterium]